MNVQKCAVKAKHKRAPVEGSVNEDAGTGTCPECLTPGVELSKGGHVGAHAIAVEVDPTLPVVDTGTPHGAPRDATVRRAVEARRIAAGTDAMPVAPAAPEGREGRRARAGASPGPALVRGRVMTPMASPVTTGGVEPAPCEDTRTGFSASAGTMYGPTGRERMDREASTVPMHGGAYGYLTLAQYKQLSRSQQRKYWAALKRMADHGRKVRAQRRARGAARVAPTGTGGLGGRSFAEGDSRETERIMRQAKS